MGGGGAIMGKTRNFRLFPAKYASSVHLSDFAGGIDIKTNDIIFLYLNEGCFVLAHPKYSGVEILPAHR